MHAIFFHPWLFENRFPSHNGESFMFKDPSDNFYKLRGPNILKTIRDHFNCSTVVGGKIIIIILI